MLYEVITLEDGGWLADEALIYLERENEGEPPSLPANWQLLKDKQAGRNNFV